MMTPRIMTALACAVIVSVPAASAVAAAKAPQGPKPHALGTLACEGSATGELAFYKGNKYVLAEGERGKFVHQVGRGVVRFKTGDLAAYAGRWDRSTEVLTLVSKEDGSDAGSCARPVVVEEPVEPPVEEPVEPPTGG